LYFYRRAKNGTTKIAFLEVENKLYALLEQGNRYKIVFMGIWRNLVAAGNLKFLGRKPVPVRVRVSLDIKREHLPAVMLETSKDG
jgi:hypothetical protein